MNNRFTRTLGCTMCVFFFLLNVVSAQQPDSPQTKQTDESPKSIQQAPKTSLRLKTSLVTFPVNVLDRHGKPIVGLESEQFEVYEDGVRQNISFFSTPDHPASIAVIFDRSTSMQLRLPRSRQALASFVKNSHAKDEYFLIAFDENVELLSAGSDGDSLLQKLSLTKAEGDTSLHDAISKGLETLQKHARHSKRALLILSDGVDTSSRTSYRALMDAAKESDCQIYFIGSADILSAGCGRICQLQTINRMHDLANVTGGQAFFLVRPQEIEEAILQIALMLRQHYSLGYSPTNDAPQEKWRKLEIKVTVPEMKSRVRARKGYFPRAEKSQVE